jgi:hypothetical protein
MTKWMIVAITAMVLAPVFFQLGLFHYRANEDTMGVLMVTLSAVTAVYSLYAARNSGKLAEQPSVSKDSVVVVLATWEAGMILQKAAVKFSNGRMRIVDISGEFKVGDHLRWSGTRFVRFE